MKLDFFLQRMTLPASTYCNLWMVREGPLTTTTVVLFDSIRITIDWTR